MRTLTITAILSLTGTAIFAQQANINPVTSAGGTENIYTIKQQFLNNVLHNPDDRGNDEDNDLERFNRWFHDVEVRTYPTGNLPRPDVLIRAYEAQASAAGASHRRTSTLTPWQPIGPMNVPSNFNGIGRVNCIVVDPVDTSKLYIGAACGGVFISHDAGTTWTSNSDQFPSLSIADIAVNPHNTDTIYAATGDGYGYEVGAYAMFWGGLYSAGVMRSTNGGNSWSTTGLSYLQSASDIIQKLLLHPNKTSLLLAATRNGILRSLDAGATWANVDAGHVYSMAFHPGRPDTVYAINTHDLRVSYNAGATWQTLAAGLNVTGDKCTIGVSPAAPNAVWVLDANNNLKWSHNEGHLFTATTSPKDTAHFAGYYDRVLGISPADSEFVLANGSIMAKSTDGGNNWHQFDYTQSVHVDNHAITFNPLHPNTIYTGNDGGISVTYDGGLSWKNISNGLMISQIYRMAVSRQDPRIILCGLQDNGTFRYDGTTWSEVTGGDGMACGINPFNDLQQVCSYQYGNFFMSADQGNSFSYTHVCSETGYWTTPVLFDPNNHSTVYFGYNNVWATYDMGASFVNLTNTSPFANGAISLAIAPSDSRVIYAADWARLLRTTDGGTTWTVVTGNLPTSQVPITHIAVDYSDPMKVYVTTSGYTSGVKVFSSATGGTTWTNISNNLPNIPADCIAVDSSTPGALFVGTDLGVYYTDASLTNWIPYSTGLPNVIVSDLDVNYTNYKIKVATYGRGVWECKLLKDPPIVSGIKKTTLSSTVQLSPNPAINYWKLIFSTQKPASYTVRVSDIAGRLIFSQENSDVIDASKLASGVYNIDVYDGKEHADFKAIKK